jgi:hypothetical protein
VYIQKPRHRKINDQRITVRLIVDKADHEDRKEYLLREISKEKGIFPLSRFDMGNLPVKIIQEFEKFPTKWKVSNTGGDSETLYEHKAGFYIYTKKGQQLSDVSLFYETTQHNEVQFFINRLMKLLE